MLRKTIWPRLTVGLGLGASLFVALPDTSAACEDGACGARAYLEFESKADGRCQILSDGGKLRVMRNAHAERAIAYRLTRIFVGVRQGLSTGVAPPGGEEVKLGCTRVDDRAQEWSIERASFTE